MKKYHYIAPYILQKIGYVISLVLFRFFVHLEIRGKEHIPHTLQLLNDKPKDDASFTAFNIISTGQVNERRQNTRGTPVLIFAANHTSELDPAIFALVLPYLSAHFPLYFVANPKEKFKTFGWRSYFYGGKFFNMLGAYPIISGQKNYEVALQHYIELLQAGRTVCIFPEGGRTKDGSLLVGHGGVAYLSYTTRSTVVPIAINTFFDLSWKTFFLRKRKVVVTVGVPIRSKEIVSGINPTIEDFRRGGSLVMDRIGELLKI